MTLPKSGRIVIGEGATPPIGAVWLVIREEFTVWPLRGFIVYMALFFALVEVVMEYVQLVSTSLGVPVSAHGWLYAGFSLVAAGGGYLAPNIRNVLGDRRWFVGGPIALVALLDREEPRVRADALSIMAAAAGASPSSYRDILPVVRDHLRSDHPAVRRGALKVVAAIGTAYPDAVADDVPRVGDQIRSAETVVEALGLVKIVARRRPAAVDPVVDDVLGVFRTLAATDVDGGETVTDPMGRAVTLGDGDRLRHVVLDVVFELAKAHPDTIRPDAQLVAELVEARAAGWQTALDVPVELDAVDSVRT